MKIYLASPLFTEYEKENVRKTAKNLRAMGHEVYVPMEHEIEDAWSYRNADWAAMVFDEDVKAIRNSDLVVCNYYGLYSDSGTAWECGFAYALSIPVQLIDYSGDEVSLMVINGAINAEQFVNKNQT